MAEHGRHVLVLTRGRGVDVVQQHDDDVLDVVGRHDAGLEQQLEVGEGLGQDGAGLGRLQEGPEEEK